MIKSMTGFGRGEFLSESRSITVEIKSVNHRFCDISVKMPKRYSYAEEALRFAVKSFASRGKIEVLVSVSSPNGSDTGLVLNIPLAKQYYGCLSKLQEEIPELKGDISIGLLSSMPEVIKGEPAEEDEEAFSENLLSAAAEAGKVFSEMKKREGEKLSEDILLHADIIIKNIDEIAVYAPSVTEKYKETLRCRIQELIGTEAAVPEDRILLEAAVFADKSDITEEITRLRSHCRQLREIILEKGGSCGPVGKQLDFLIQEMNRESNTIASKANDIEITRHALILKNEIEKIREQVQNIE